MSVPGNLLAKPEPTELLRTIWVSTNPPVIGSLAASHAFHGWLALQACDDTRVVHLGDEPVVGADNIWASRGDDDWTVWHGRVEVGTFAADRSLALSPH